ncbi:MAG: DUF4350 domain-containing protein [Sphingobacteriaceae bacterium]|nr:DUF4350 domain-containing protein [Sphingobacteriaceae bacterium]
MRDLKLYLVIAFSLLAFYIIAQYNRPRPVNWKPTFDKKDKIPFGTYILYNQLKDIFPNSRIRPLRSAPYVTLEDQKAAPGNYLLIAPYVKLDEYDFKELFKYMKTGNNVFIASFNLSSYLEDSLKLKINSERKFDLDAAIPVNFVNPSLAPSKKYVFDRGIGEQYFSSFDTSKTVILGVNKTGHPNFIKYNYGKGALYLLASPMFFTNYNLLKPGGADYAAKALSYLPAKSEIIWDEFSSLGPPDDGESPLRVLLTFTPLKWAYFISLFSLIAFVLYEIKRRQRIIPVIEPLRNSSAEFVRVVGQVYYQQRNNSNIAHKKISYFLEDIRAKYNLKTQILNQEFAGLLAAKSGVSNHLITTLLNQVSELRESKKVTDLQLIALNNNIEQFHYQSKQ